MPTNKQNGTNGSTAATGTNDPWAAVDAIHAAAGMVDDDVPECAFTVAQYVAHYGIPRPTAESRIARLLESGALKRGRKVSTTSSGRRAVVIHYWPA